MRKKAKKAGAGGQGKGSSAKEPAVAQVESAESLYGKRWVQLVLGRGGAADNPL
jgi:hypothetical protein